MPTVIQSAFSKGEIAPSLYGRVDTSIYALALKTALNCIIHAYGGVSNRTGLLWLAPVKDHSYAPRLIRFRFKATDTYQLEFGDKYMRVIRDDGHVVEAAVNITGITNANPGVVTAVAHDYSTGQEVFIDDVVGMTRLNERRFRVGATTTDTFQLKDQVTDANVDTTSLGAYTSGGTAARIYEIATPYAAADVGLLKFTQSADVMTLTHPSYPRMKLSRNDHDDWTLEEVTADPEIDHPTGLSVTVNSAAAVTYSYRVTAIADETFEESLPALNTNTETITAATQANPVVITVTGHPYATGDEIEINDIVGMTELNGRRFLVDVVNVNSVSLRGLDGTLFAAYVSGGSANRTFFKVTNGHATANNTINWTAVAGAQKYNVYKAKNGIYGLIGATEGVTFTDSNMDPDLDVSPPQQRNPFIGEGNYPGTVGYYEQRIIYGGSILKPDTWNASQTANHDNFSVSSPIQQDDAITATLTSREVNDIRSFVGLAGSLLIFTGGGEWTVSSGSDLAFAADTIRQKSQSTWGASHDAPLLIGTTVLYVQENNSTVRSIGYSFTNDSYTGTDMTLLANHLFQTFSIAGWDFARSPDPIAYTVRSDGIVCCMTFQQEQEVVAWSRWRTDGKFERISTSRPSQTAIDEAAYFVVKRRVNGNIVRYIERTVSRRFTDVKDCFFVDSGVTFDNPIAITAADIDNPLVITAPGHGFSNGDEVDFSDMLWEHTYDEFFNEMQPDQLNGKRYTVVNVAGDDFELEDENGDAVDPTGWAEWKEGGYARKATDTFTGFDHLEGKTIVALADGSVITDIVVENGGFTLPHKASRLHAGLRFVADVETLNIEAPQGTIQGKNMRIPKVTIRVDRTVGLFVGPNFFDMVEKDQREAENYNSPVELFTDDLLVTIPSQWNMHGRLAMRQANPLPMTILAVVPDLILEDEAA